MQIYLDEISSDVATSAHAAILMDRAGWHTTGKLDVPDNITINLLPSRSSELNSLEDVWHTSARTGSRIVYSPTKKPFSR